ncbi:unnamed protein product [Ambrosiozyma monospora]|uniref:Unnamed protein product n=1 Tax=Ambrosiozyma monospora TaxID=43982 RepID=A0ACB5U058_AMBMO|nr:unnamed protein product [Ambrosiozyma monospora]
MEYLKLCFEYEPGSNLNSLCLQYAHIFEKRPEVNFKFVRVDHDQGEPIKTQNDHYFDLFDDLSPILRYFESIGLPFDNKIIHYSNKLSVSKLCLEDDPHEIHLNIREPKLLLFQNNRLKELKFSWVSLKSPVMVNMKDLTKLTRLEIVNCTFDGEVFEKYPDSLHIIHLKNCKAFGVLSLPTSLRLLKLNNSYPKISIAEPRPMESSLVLHVELHDSN